jgi:A/G-specific adenine glycosylase
MRPSQASFSLPEAKVAAVRGAVVAWYRAHGRDLPWRRTRDPYAVLVSELMLQQQTVRHVIPVYCRFLERFPDLATLAGAARAEVIRVWQPLGRYASAVRLHAIARRLVGDGGGSVPREIEALGELGGIGRYTAGAIVCFAYDVPAPLVDTNVRRVLRRLFGAGLPWAGAGPGGSGRWSGQDERLAWRLAEALVPATGAYEWNQGLMDLGAALCIARTPRCDGCPVAPWCDYKAGYVDPPRGDALRGVAETRAAYGAEPEAASQAPDPGRPRTVPFEGSRRWYRGQIMQALCALPVGEALPLEALGRRLGLDAPAEGPALLDDLVAALAREGLVRSEVRGDGAVWLALPD